MGLTDCHTLEGREIGDIQADGAPCIFCGQHIRHINNGGVGWLVGAVGPDAKPHWYLYCNDPCEPQAKVMRELGITPETPEKDRVVFRCGCVSDYVESVGDQCHECKMDREHLVPWEGDTPISMRTKENPNRRYLIDLPCPENFDVGGSMVTVAEFTSRSDAVKFCMEKLGTDNNGMLCLITEVDE